MRRLLALGVVASLVLFGGILAAGLVASGLGMSSGPANASVTEFEPRVAVNEGDWTNETDGDGVQTCMAVGPPPGNYGVTGSLVVERPARGGGPDEATFRTEIALADGTELEKQNVTLERGESERVQLFSIGRNDGALAAGTSANVTVHVDHGDATVVNATRTVDVRESGELDCDEESS